MSFAKEPQNCRRKHSGIKLILKFLTMKKVKMQEMKAISKEDLKRIVGGSPSPGECIMAAKLLGIDPIRYCCPACNQV
jgi:hypothetical protein